MRQVEVLDKTLERVEVVVDVTAYFMLGHRFEPLPHGVGIRAEKDTVRPANEKGPDA